MRQKRPAVLSAISMTAILLTVAGSATPAAAAQPITCGMTVTTNIRLTRDLTCSGPGLIIGADNVTIDLGGHTLAGAGPTTSTDIGIRAEGHANLRIQRGTITGFRQAVDLNEVRNVVLRGLRVTDNTPLTSSWYGRIYVQGSENVDILDSQIVQPRQTNSMSTEFTRSMRVERVLLSGSFDWATSTSISVTHSKITDGSLFFYDSTSGVQVRHNVLRRSNVGVSQASAVISDNHFISPIRSAINLSLTNGPVVERNIITGAVYGVNIDVPVVRDARIQNNVFRDNDYGVVLTERDLIGENLFIADNLFTGNRQAGIFFEAERIAGRNTPLTVTRNTFIRNGHGSTDTDSAGRRINDGIHTNLPIGSLLTISHNRTYFNADHGIEALPADSVIDGGGNRSTGDPNGCAGVTCA